MPLVTLLQIKSFHAVNNEVPGTQSINIVLYARRAKSSLIKKISGKLIRHKWLPVTNSTIHENIFTRRTCFEKLQTA